MSMVLEGGDFVNPDLYSPETGNNPKLTVAQFVRNNARSNVRFLIMPQSLRGRQGMLADVERAQEG